MSEWIKMKDKLPEIGKHVLFFEPGPNEQCRVGRIEERDVLSGPPILEVRDLHSGSTIGIGWFTHWMPLPEPPKGE